MEGLKYILSEIETRQYLLHDFVKSMETSKDFALLSGDVPDFVRDGEIIYRPNTEDEPYRNLKVGDFNSFYREKFLDLQGWSRLLIPLNPRKLQPANYEFNELLVYEFGGGYCQASIYMWLINPYLRLNDRKFYLIVEHRRTPKPIIKYIKNGQEWTYPGGFKIDDSELEKFLIDIHPYTRWKKDARKANPKLKEVNDRKNIGGAAIAHEGGKIFTVPIIVIDERTQIKTVWEQLLICAWGHGYFDQNGEPLAYEQLKQYYKEDVLIDLLMHFRKHTFSPYDAITNLNYIKRVFSGYFKKQKHKESSGVRYKRRTDNDEEDTLKGDTLPGDTIGGNKLADGTFERISISDKELSEVYYPYPPGSVLDAAQQTEVSEWIIWRLVRQDKLKAVKNDNGFVILDDSAINQLRHLASQKNKRNNIFTLARSKGKSRPAIKKWLQRHRELTENEFRESFIKWLNKTRNQKGGKPQ